MPRDRHRSGTRLILPADEKPPRERAAPPAGRHSGHSDCSFLSLAVLHRVIHAGTRDPGWHANAVGAATGNLRPEIPVFQPANASLPATLNRARWQSASMACLEEIPSAGSKPSGSNLAGTDLAGCSPGGVETSNFETTEAEQMQSRLSETKNRQDSASKPAVLLAVPSLQPKLATISLCRGHAP